MVRLKNRWLIARVDNAEDSTTTTAMAPNLPSRRDFFAVLNESMMESFGVASSGYLRDTKVQLSDNLSRLVFIKVPRDFAAKTRAALACLTSLPSMKGGQTVPVTICVIGEHGSLRTAKRSMILKLRQAYRDHLKKSKNSETIKREAIALSLQNTLQELHAIEF